MRSPSLCLSVRLGFASRILAPLPEMQTRGSWHLQRDLEGYLMVSADSISTPKCFVTAACGLWSWHSLPVLSALQKKSLSHPRRGIFSQ